MLQTHTKMYAPVIVQAILQKSASLTASASLNPDEPLVELSMKLAEISTAPVPDELFQVPADYQSASMQDVLKSALPTGQQAGAKGAFRVEAGVTAPALLLTREPEYTPEASKAQIQGTVILYVEVGTDGLAHNVKIIRSLRPDLDEKAIEAISYWRFRPGTKDGKPVVVAATVEVNFSLLHSLPPPPQ